MINIAYINATILILSGIISLILSTCFKSKETPSRASRLFFAMSVISTIAMFLRAASKLMGKGDPGLAEKIITSVSLIFICVAVFFYCLYLIDAINATRKVKMGIAIPIHMTAVYAVGVAIQLYSLYTGKNYEWPSTFGEAGLFVFALAVLFVNKSHLEDLTVFRLMLLPGFLLAGAVFEPFSRGIVLRFSALVIGLMVLFIKHHIKAEQARKDTEVAVLEGRLQLAAGRMKPHYIYNVLTNIYYLVDIDTEKAQSAISSFSEYLRDTLETIDIKGIVPFERELNQIRNYLALEEMRFADKLKTKYDIDVDNFNIPPLTILPLVENAVKHGINGLDKPGTVTLMTRMTAHGVKIKVIDDGIGFDVSKIKENEEKYKDLISIRERIRNEANGDMIIESVPGSGTTVTIDLEVTKWITKEDSRR